MTLTIQDPRILITRAEFEAVAATVGSNNPDIGQAVLRRRRRALAGAD
ncbi:hypothetical protein ABZZ17_18015 [Streptomyces sp. NPDC006512]